MCFCEECAEAGSRSCYLPTEFEGRKGSAWLGGIIVV